MLSVKCGITWVLADMRVEMWLPGTLNFEAGHHVMVVVVMISELLKHIEADHLQMCRQWHIQLWIWSFYDDDDDYMMVETKMDKTGLPLRNISEAGTSFPFIFLLTSLQVQTLRDCFQLTIDLLNTLVHCTFGMAMSMTIRHWFCVSFCCMICQNHNIYQPFFSVWIWEKLILILWS